MSPTDLPYTMPDRFYRAAGPALVRWAGLQRLLLGAQGSSGAPNLAESPGGTVEHRAFPLLVRESFVPMHESPVLTPESPVLMHESSIPALGVRESAVPSLGVREPAVPALGVREPAVPALRVSEPAVPFLGARWPAVPALGIREPAVPVHALHESAVPGHESPSVLMHGPSAPVPAPAAPGSPTSGPTPTIRGPAAVPGLTGLLEAAACRSRRQHLLLDLAVTQLPTAAALHAPPPPAETAGRATAPAEAPAIRFSPPGDPVSSYSRGTPAAGPTPLADVRVSDEAPPGTDDFIFEERVRGVLDRILRTDALRHGLALGER